MPSPLCFDDVADFRDAYTNAAGSQLIVKAPQEDDAQLGSFAASVKRGETRFLLTQAQVDEVIAAADPAEVAAQLSEFAA